MSRIPGDRPDVRRRALLGVGGLLIVLGLGALVWVLIPPPSGPVGGAPTASGSGEPSPSLSPSAPAPNPSSADQTDAASPTPEPGTSVTAAPVAPGESGPAITSFTVSPVTAHCRDERAGTMPLTFAWTSEGAERAWIGVGTTDASLQPYAEVALADAAYTGLTFACNTPQKVFTLTVEGEAGRTSRSVMVTRQLE